MMARDITERVGERMSDVDQRNGASKTEGREDWRSRLLWFVGLWTVSVLSLGAVSMLLRWVLLGS